MSDRTVWCILLAPFAYTLLGCMVLAWVDKDLRLARWVDDTPPRLKTIMSFIVAVGWPYLVWRYCSEATPNPYAEDEKEE